MKPRATRLVPLALTLSLAALPARPQVRGLEPQEYGTTSHVAYNLDPSDFQLAGAYVSDPPGRIVLSSGSTCYTELFIPGGYYAEPAVAEIVAPLHLPAGARITSITVFYFDNHPTEDPVVELIKYEEPYCGQRMHQMSFPVFAGGDNSVTDLVDLEPVDNETHHYSVRATLYRSEYPELDTTSLYRVRIRYLRQVSPAPSSATFDDVAEDHPYFQFVEALFASGITAGCEKFPPMFCPNRPVTRGEMAVFLAKALGLHWPVSP